MCARTCTCDLSVRTSCVCACVRACALGSLGAFLSCLAQFALFVFNDASREADSRRVERAAFDVSDYDITDVQPRRAEEWGSAFSLFSFSFFFFTLIHPHPSGTLFREKGGRDRGSEKRKRGWMERLNIWPKPGCEFCLQTKRRRRLMFSRLHGPEDMGAKTIFLLSVPSLIIVKEPGLRRRRRLHSK